MMDFVEFPKIPRLKRNCVITEKIDGSNGQIFITEVTNSMDPGDFLKVIGGRGIAAGSRNRWLQPGKSTDNFGFAAWVLDHADVLIEKLGLGRHYGEWWGSGIQRGYGLQNGEKRFSLFNTKRWGAAAGGLIPIPFFPCSVVPTLYEGEFCTLTMTGTLIDLQRSGSQAAPGFMQPEGIVVYHAASGDLYKVTLDNDGQPKGKVAA
jgi:hypothetical protein